MKCKKCEGTFELTAANYCPICGQRLSKSAKGIKWFLIIPLVIGALSGFVTIELNSRLTNSSIFFSVVLATIAAFFVLQVMPKHENKGIKNISDIAIASGFGYIFYCMTMLFVSGNTVTWMMVINSFYIGSAHITLLIVCNLLAIVFAKAFASLFGVKIEKKHIHKTLDTAEAIVDLTTPKGFISRLRKMIDHE